MHLLLNFLISIFVHLFFLFVIAKGLTGDFRLHPKENIHLILTGVLLAAVRVFILQFDFPNLSAQLFSDMNFLMIVFLYLPALFIYFYKARQFSVKNSVSLMASVTSITMASDFIVDIASAAFFPHLRLHCDMTLMQDLFPIALHLLLHGAVTVALIFIIYRAAKGLYAKPVLSQRLQNTLLFVSVTALALSMAALFAFYSREEDLLYGEWSWTVFASFTLIYLLLVVSLVHTRFLDLKYEQQRKEADLQALRHYTEELERQQIAMRKFKHDYQNILFSMREFIQSKDLAGLQAYYSSKIEPASEVITKNTFALDGLGKIKVPEIKSILAAKLMLAQNIGINIQTTFEANENIDHISIDSVALVRMLGILLDNAIEALTELGRGTLFVACLKWEAGVTFIVRNTCRPDLPPIHQQWEPGFSTKGENRGLGLSNLSELINAYANVTIKTSIREGVFSQELLIEGNEREGKRR